MSNSAVGSVYEQIINEVLEASRVDLEENGVDESILEELKQGWQKKLSQQQLAVFPWDPKPDVPAQTSQPASAPPQPGPVPTPVGAAVNGYAPPHQRMAPQPVQNGMNYGGGQPTGDARIKAEPGVKVEPGLEQNPMMNHAATGSDVARARALENIQMQYGDRANASMSKLQGSMGHMPNGAVPGQPRLPVQQPIPQPHPGQYQHNPQQQQYRPPMPMPMQNPHQPQRMPQNGQKPAVGQTDGASDADFSGALLRQDASGHTRELGRVEIDGMLRAQIEARARAMEGGGLMVPLKRTAKGDPISSAAYQRAPGGETGPARFDGGDDEVKSEDDDEAINSDLDDSEDNIDEDDEDEDGGQIMLCMYDKVQRVKNKWKCVLKDGVLSINGKDYVFHKANGEYEW